MIPRDEFVPADVQFGLNHIMCIREFARRQMTVGVNGFVS
jgi:hypothetical protein